MQVYLEPGEAAITGTTTLEVTVLDTLFNGKNLAIVDSSTASAHARSADLPPRAPRWSPMRGRTSTRSAGNHVSPATYSASSVSPTRSSPGDRLSIQDAAGYTMVKKNWFNGVAMPGIAIREKDGTITSVTTFDYEDYAASLS